MSLETDQLRETLAQLHQQLAKARPLEADVETRLRKAVEEIQEALESQSAPSGSDQSASDQPSGERPHDEPSLVDRLRESAEHFEHSHPTISGTLGRLVDVLAQLGI